MQTIKFYSFDRPASGRIITHHGDLAVVQSRNPSGGHNLVLVDLDRCEAIRHGTATTAACAAEWMSRRAYRKVRSFLASRGIGRDWRTE